jgi:hypothetical protein
MDELEQMKAENQMLREALSEIVQCFSYRPYKCLVEDSSRAYGIAITALRQSTHAILILHSTVGSAGQEPEQERRKTP